MRKTLLTVILLMACRSSYAQISSELLFGNRQVHYISYWQKDIDSLGKYNLFNLNRFAKDFKDKAYTNYSIDAQLSYRIKKWFGIAVGAGYDGETMEPTLGLSLSIRNKKGDFLIEAYPTISFAKKITPSFFTLVGYNPIINQKWGFSNQLIFVLNGTSSSQLVRIGLDFKNKLQFGLGSDIIYFYDKGPNLHNFGYFIRLNL